MCGEHGEHQRAAKYWRLPEVVGRLPEVVFSKSRIRIGMRIDKVSDEVRGDKVA